MSATPLASADHRVIASASPSIEPAPTLPSPALRTGEGSDGRGGGG